MTRWATVRISLVFAVGIGLLGCDSNGSSGGDGGVGQDVQDVVHALDIGHRLGCAFAERLGLVCWNPTAEDTAERNQGFEQSVEALQVGRDHSCLITEGDAWCWGEGKYGELGQDLYQSDEPVQNKEGVYALRVVPSRRLATTSQ